MVFFNSAQVRKAIQTLIVIWAVFVILLYYIHYNHWLENLNSDIPRVFESLWSYVVLKCLWVIGFLILGYGVGRGVLDLIRVSSAFDTIEDDLVYSIGIGWGLIGLGTLFLGTLGFLRPVLHVAIAVILIIASHRQLYRLYLRLISVPKSVDYSTIELFFLLTISAIVLWGFPLSLVPEYGFDSLNSHLPAALRYLEEGRITFHPELNFNNFPETVEMWFLQSMMLIPRGAGPLIMMTCHLLSALAVYAMSRRFIGRGPALVAVLCYVLIKKVFLFATLAYIDQGLMFLSILGIYAVLRYAESPSRPVAILAGLALGFACGVKYSAFITVLTLFIVALIYMFAVKREKVNASAVTIDFFLAAIALILVACPWYIRNYIWFENPFFPFYTNIFPSTGGTYAQYASELTVDHREMLKMFVTENKRQFIPFLGLPYTLTFDPFGPYDEVQEVGSIGPFFLIALPLIVFLKRIPRIFWCLIIFVVLTFAYWWFFEGMLHLRYMLPVLSVMTMVAGFLYWEGLKLEKVNPRSFAGWFVFAAIFGILITYFAGMVTPLQVRGQFPILPEERQNFVQERMNAYPIITSLNEQFSAGGQDPSEKKVYGFYLEQYRWFSDFKLYGNQIGYANHMEYLRHCHSAEDLYSWLKDYGCDYLIINLAYAKMALGEQAEIAVPSMMPDCDSYFELESSLYWVLVYRLKEPEAQ
ncbi:MAG: phospholipid carrier-dependent glycosyltransferase [bacterium]